VTRRGIGAGEKALHLLAGQRFLADPLERLTPGWPDPAPEASMKRMIADVTTEEASL
jgi:hypothetical protein